MSEPSGEALSLLPLNEANPTPLYLQLQQSIEEAVRKGDLKADAALPGERDLAKQLGISRVTVRKAITGLVQKGVLVQRWGWPAVFWFNLPVGALGVALALTLVRRRGGQRSAEPLDWPGVGLVTAGLFCLTLGIIQGNDWGWTSPVILGLFAAAAAILGVWIWWELRTSSPLFDLRLFRKRTFAAASSAIMTVDTAMMGTSFMLVIFMIAMMDYTELKAGLAIAVLPAAVLVLTPIAGWLTDRIGPRVPAVAGALVAAAGLVALGYLDPTDPLGSVLWRSGLVGAGIGLSLPALLAAGMSVVPGGVKGAGSGMLNTARQLGFLLGVAILVAVFAHTMNGAVNQAADKGQALVREDTALSDPVRSRLVDALDEARTIDATAGMSELRRVAHPIAEDIGQDVGFFEGIELLRLKDILENLLWDEVSAAFRWPFFVAAMAAGLGALAGAFLPRRLSSRRPQA